MWSWITNNPDAVVAIASVVGGFLFKAKKEANLDAMKDKLLAKLRRELLGLLETYASVDKARVALNEAADRLLVELKVKRNAVVDVVVDALLEQALKEYAEKLATVQLHLKVAELFGAVEKLPGALEADMKKLDAADKAFREASNVEVVTELPK